MGAITSLLERVFLDTSDINDNKSDNLTPDLKASMDEISKEETKYNQDRLTGNKKSDFVRHVQSNNKSKSQQSSRKRNIDRADDDERQI